MDSNIIQEHYTTLKIPPYTKCIRLLHVHAAIGSEGYDELLRCDINVYDLDTNPSYTALSYVWGVVPPSPDTILCGDIQLPISANGLSALRHLRAKLGAFTIWIDAVCINQLDDEEKVQQIPLMGGIYTGAATSYFWLGESSPAKQRAMDYLSRAGSLPYYSKDCDLKWDGGVKRGGLAAMFHFYRYVWSFQHSPIPYDTANLPWSRRIMPNNGGGTSFNDIDQLLDCVWITRIWTYQEAALAHNPIIVCGHSHIRWSQFSIGVIFISNISQSKFLHQWIETVVSRAMFQAKVAGDEIHLEQLNDYYNFSSHLYGLKSPLWIPTALWLWFAIFYRIGYDG